VPPFFCKDIFQYVLSTDLVEETRLRFLHCFLALSVPSRSPILCVVLGLGGLSIYHEDSLICPEL